MPSVIYITFSGFYYFHSHFSYVRNGFFLLSSPPLWYQIFVTSDNPEPPTLLAPFPPVPPSVIPLLLGLHISFELCKSSDGGRFKVIRMSCQTPHILWHLQRIFPCGSFAKLVTHIYLNIYTDSCAVALLTTGLSTVVIHRSTSTPPLTLRQPSTCHSRRLQVRLPWYPPSHGGLPSRPLHLGSRPLFRILFSASLYTSLAHQRIDCASSVFRASLCQAVFL